MGVAIKYIVLNFYGDASVLLDCPKENDLRVVTAVEHFCSIVLLEFYRLYFIDES